MDNTPELAQIVYMSALADHADDACLRDILAESTAKNPARHITGILLYVNGSFLQVLEGHPQTLKELYRRIHSDPRHTGVVKISQQAIEDREFGEWSMGWAQVAAADLDQIAGKNDFFTHGHCLTELDNTVVRRILADFKQGRWRQQIQ